MIRCTANLKPQLTLFRSEGSEFSWPVLVVDDFFEDPEAVRQIAVSLNYREGRLAYPGVSASVLVPQWPLLDAVRDLLSSAFVETYNAEAQVGLVPLDSTHPVPDHRHLPPTCTRPKWLTDVVSPQLFRRDVATFTAFHYDEPPTFQIDLPHTDGYGRDFARLPFSCLVYLNPAPSPHGGTGFFQHNQSGQVALPFRVEDYVPDLCDRLDVPGFVELARKLTWLDGKQGDWTLRLHVENKFNRFVCFAGNLLHSIYSHPLERPTLDTVRLTTNEFFDVHTSPISTVGPA